jgi:hypothetical protein
MARFERTNSSQAPQSTDSSEDWKSDGFINLTLNLPDQAPVRLPSLALKKKPYAKLLAWLTEDPSRVQKLLPYLVADFKLPAPVEKDMDFTKLA